MSVINKKVNIYAVEIQNPISRILTKYYVEAISGDSEEEWTKIPFFLDLNKKYVWETKLKTDKLGLVQACVESKRKTIETIISQTLNKIPIKLKKLEGSKYLYEIHTTRPLNSEEKEKLGIN